MLKKHSVSVPQDHRNPQVARAVTGQQSPITTIVFRNMATWAEVPSGSPWTLSKSMTLGPLIGRLIPEVVLDWKSLS